MIKTIYSVLKYFLTIFSAFFILSCGVYYYWIYTNFHGDLGPKSGFILLLLLGLIVAMMVTFLYYIIYHYVGNRKHLMKIVIFFGIFVIMPIYYFSVNSVLDGLLFISNGNKSNWFFEIFETYSIIIYPSLLSIIFFFSSFFIRNKFIKQ